MNPKPSALRTGPVLAVLVALVLAIATAYVYWARKPVPQADFTTLDCERTST